MVKKSGTIKDPIRYSTSGVTLATQLIASTELRIASKDMKLKMSKRT
jgi:hypothetical protein